MPSVVNLNGYGARVATNFREPGHSSAPQYRFRPQMRGEAFDQPSRINYVFGTCEQPIPMSLCAFHEQRLIVAEVDITTNASLTAEFPNLSKRKKEFADRLLGQLRSSYDCLFAKLVRWFQRKRGALDVEGPFIPYEPSIALVTLVVRVSRDANFDDAYRIAKRFFELHRENEDYEKFKIQWGKSKLPVSKKDGYPWTATQLKAIEDMAPLEPSDSGELGFYRSKEERQQYNERIWKRCQARPETGVTNASQASNRALRDFFSRK